MLLLLSVFMGLFGVVLPLDMIFYTGDIARMFPGYMPTLVSLSGLVIAGLVHSDLKKRRKAKKLRSRAVAGAVFCLCSCLFATGYWLYRIYFVS